MNDKRASRRVCANCKQVWSNSALKRHNKRYICPECARAKKAQSVLRRAQGKRLGVEHFEKTYLLKISSGTSLPYGDQRPTRQTE